MKKILLALSFLAFAGTAVSADVLSDRQALMKERGRLTGELGKVVKGEQAFDAATVLATLQAMKDNAARLDIDALYPEGSNSGDTTAAPAIWEDPEGFKAAEKAFQDAVDVAVADAPADLDALKVKFAPIGASCGACHQVYRIRKD